MIDKILDSIIIAINLEFQLLQGLQSAVSYYKPQIDTVTHLNFVKELAKLLRKFMALISLLKNIPYAFLH